MVASGTTSAPGATDGSGGPRAQERRLRVLVGGGVRSGKSAFALERARALGERRLLVATAEALDDEMRERVARHREERGAGFATLEEPLELPAALAGLRGAGAPEVAVVDCLTLWLSNLLLGGAGETGALARIDELGALLDDPPCHIVLVSNEVGFGVVPETALGRAFRDLVGRAHQRLAPRCDELYLAAMGVVLRLRPEPLAVAGSGASGPGPGSASHGAPMASGSTATRRSRAAARSARS